MGWTRKPLLSRLVSLPVNQLEISLQQKKLLTRYALAEDFQKLEIWQEGASLAVQVYSLTCNFPKAEVFGLTSQLRRCANSIIANIAEASGRYFIKDKQRVLFQARGEIEEIKSHLILSIRLGYCKPEQANKLIDKYGLLGRRLNAFIKSLIK